MHNRIHEILKQYWGYDEFRSLQEEIILSVLEGKDTLALMPTGGGKSITYQVPALVLEGICLVVTPLIALMKDQVEELQKRGIVAEAIYTGMGKEQIESTLNKAIAGKIKFLYVSPERLASEQFRARLKQMHLSMLAVDEAHCISQWGYDFRPSYLRIAEIRENFRQMVWPLPVGDLLYVGRAAAETMKKFGVRTIGDLARFDRESLFHLLGRHGAQLHDYANGLDTDPVRSRYEPEMVKSVGNGTTFPKNLTTAEQVRGGVAVLADSVATRLRHSGLYAGGVQVTVRDPQFHDRSRQMQLSAPTHLIRELTAAAMDLTGQLWKPPAPVRALTVTAIHLVRSEDAYEQVDLFTAGAAPKKEKQEKLEAAMDRLRGKFGTDVISYGAARPEKEEDPLP